MKDQLLNNKKLVAAAEELLAMYMKDSSRAAIVPDNDVEKLKELVKRLVDALADAILRARKEWDRANDSGADDLADKIKDATHELTLLIIILNRHLIEFIDSQEEVKKASQRMKDVIGQAEEIKASAAQTAKFFKEFKGLIDNVVGLIKLVKA